MRYDWQVPAPPPSSWNDERLNQGFADVHKDIDELKMDIRVIAPLVGNVAGITARVDAITRDLTKVEGAVKDYVGRSVTKQLVVVSTPLFLTAVGVLIGLLSGKLG